MKLSTGIVGALAITTAMGVGFVGLPGTADAALLAPYGGDTGPELFTTEVKRDQNLSGGQRGNDVFLRNGAGFSGPSFNFNWGASGTVYDWMAEYDGDGAKLTFDGRELSINVSPDGNWNAVEFFLKADEWVGFTTATTTVAITEADGMAQTEILSVTDGRLGALFVLDDLSSIGKITGTVKFDFVANGNSTSSPNSRLAFNVKAREVAVPEPGTVALLLVGLLGLAAGAARKKHLI